ncbi:aldehyde dehydrogenase family protein [candidate division KSB1 bacterium]
MKMLIGGEWIDKKEKIEVRNKFNGELIDTVPDADENDVKRAIDIAEKGFEIAKGLPVHKRIDILKKAASIIENNKEEIARLIASEGVKTIGETRREALRGINTLTISAEEARKIAGETLPFESVPGSENRVGYYYRFPIGIISAIISFNDPLTLASHKIGPAIASGNAVILKPSELVPLTALKLGEILLQAGLPGEMLSIIPGRPERIGDALVTDERIRMVCFTGGRKTGIEIAKKAGFKKIQMEMGSNSPVIVMDDAAIDKAVALCVSGAFGAAGQNCIGVQRIYLMDKVYEKFTEKFVKKTSALKTGYNLDEKSDMGPIISEKEPIRIEEWVNDASKKGAKVHTGGKRENTVYLPTVLTDVPGNAIIDREEIFGPVVSLYKVTSLEEAIKRSNDVEYGLNAAIFTNSIDHAFKAVKELNAGTVIVNDSTDYRIDQMPFGGIKYSGLGREGIRHSIMDLTETKVVCFNL